MSCFNFGKDVIEFSWWIQKTVVETGEKKILIFGQRKRGSEILTFENLKEDKKSGQKIFFFEI